MTMLSQLQERLPLTRWGGRTFDIGLAYLVEHFSDLFEEEDDAMRFCGQNEDLQSVLHDLLCIASALDVDMGVAVRKKYRNQCPRCHSNPCVCWDDEVKPPYKLYPGFPPKENHLWRIQEMLGEVFPPHHTLAEETQHFRDEVLELDEAINKNSKEGMEEELADIFAWLVRVANTLGVSLDKQAPVR
ncbi:hypothetical protein IH982_00910 [Patescibacteria group bacterium]|nr:hypothetical protein [Patescibacteria group bacterium]